MNSFVFIVKLLLAIVIIICAILIIAASARHLRTRGNPAGVSRPRHRARGSRDLASLLAKFGSWLKSVVDMALAQPAPAADTVRRSFFHPTDVRMGTDTSDNDFMLSDPENFWGTPIAPTSQAQPSPMPVGGSRHGYILKLTFSNCAVAGNQLGGNRTTGGQNEIFISPEHLPLSIGRQCSRGNYINLADPTIHQNHIRLFIDGNELKLTAAGNADIYDRSFAKVASIAARETYAVTDSVFSIFIGDNKTLISVTVYKSSAVQSRDRIVLTSELSPADTTDDALGRSTMFRTLGTFSVTEGKPVTACSLLANNPQFINNPNNSNYMRNGSSLFELRANNCGTFTVESSSYANCLFMICGNDGSICRDRRFKIDVDKGSVFIACVKNRFYRMTVTDIEHGEDFGENYTC